MSGPTQDLLRAREQTHGKFCEQARLAQALKEVMRLQPHFQELASTQQEALEMIATKIARILSGDASHVDHWDDIAGYAALVADSRRN